MSLRNSVSILANKSRRPADDWAIWSTPTGSKIRVDKQTAALTSILFVCISRMHTTVMGGIAKLRTYVRNFPT